MVTKHSMYRNMAVLCYKQQQIILIGGMVVLMGFLCRRSYVLVPQAKHMHTATAIYASHLRKHINLRLSIYNVKHKKSRG